MTRKKYLRPRPPSAAASTALSVSQSEGWRGRVAGSKRFSRGQCTWFMDYIFVVPMGVATASSVAYFEYL